MKIDTNSGYNKVVGPEVNQALADLQNSGCTIDSINQQGVDGRNAYVFIVYNDPRFDKKVTPNGKTTPTNPAATPEA